MELDQLHATIRQIPDYPRKGINFYDLSTLFLNRDAFRSSIQHMCAPYRGDSVDVIAGIEARGFVIGSAMAYELGLGMVMLRKLGKLPGETAGQSYQLEYGEAHIEIHRDAVTSGQRVLIVDDLLATGGTAKAAAQLVERLGGRVAGYAFLVELAFLNGRKGLPSADVFSILRYNGDE